MSLWGPQLFISALTECGCSRAYDNWLLSSLYLPRRLVQGVSMLPSLQSEAAAVGSSFTCAPIASPKGVTTATDAPKIAETQREDAYRALPAQFPWEADPAQSLPSI